MSFWSKIGGVAKGFVPVLLGVFLRKGRKAKPRDAVDAIIEEAIGLVFKAAAGQFGEYADVERALYDELDGYGYNARDDAILRHRISARLPSAFAQHKRGQV